MPLELDAWRIDGDRAEPMAFTPLDFESRLQDLLAEDIGVADPNLLLIGREVSTETGKKIDLLAMNRDGHLVVLELKRDKTPRDIVAQVLDYGAYVRTLDDEDIAAVFESFQQKYQPGQASKSINDAFCERFELPTMPDELNDAHELVIVLRTWTRRLKESSSIWRRSMGQILMPYSSDASKTRDASI